MFLKLLQYSIALILALNCVYAKPLPSLQLPDKIGSEHVLVLYKQGDNHSQSIAEYYAAKRHIPSSQVTAIALPADRAKLTPSQFHALQQNLKPKLTSNIKLIVLTFHTPYRVACMSITSAFALGYDEKFCGQKPDKKAKCNSTAPNPYYNNQSHLLWKKDSPLKLSIMLSAKTVQQAKSLIDRGVAADNTYPKGHGYLVKTHDRARSSRSAIFKRFAEIWQQSHGIHVHYIDDSKNKATSSIKYKKNVLFYHTGLKQVPDIHTNHYLPGAIADHLTSSGGKGISRSGQMKAFRWLENGATGSYGAVVEPCNFTEKFPNPQVLIPNYANGDSLIEAYWKSVQQPGEGLFIGEPLARPWNKTLMTFQGQTLLIHSRELDLNSQYLIEQRNQLNQPWQDTPEGVTATLKNNYLEIAIPNATAKYYRISKQDFYPGISGLP